MNKLKYLSLISYLPRNKKIKGFAPPLLFKTILSPIPLALRSSPSPLTLFVFSLLVKKQILAPIPRRGMAKPPPSPTLRVGEGGGASILPEGYAYPCGVRSAYYPRRPVNPFGVYLVALEESYICKPDRVYQGTQLSTILQPRHPPSPLTNPNRNPDGFNHRGYLAFGVRLGKSLLFKILSVLIFNFKILLFSVKTIIKTFGNKNVSFLIKKLNNKIATWLKYVVFVNPCLRVLRVQKKVDLFNSSLPALSVALYFLKSYVPCFAPPDTLPTETSSSRLFSPFIPYSSFLLFSPKGRILAPPPSRVLTPSRGLVKGLGKLRALSPAGIRLRAPTGDNLTLLEGLKLEKKVIRVFLKTNKGLILKLSTYLTLYIYKLLWKWVYSPKGGNCKLTRRALAAKLWIFIQKKIKFYCLI